LSFVFKQGLKILRRQEKAKARRKILEKYFGSEI